MLDFEAMMYAFMEWYIEHEHKRFFNNESLEESARTEWDDVMKEYNRIHADKQRLLAKTQAPGGYPQP